jgi:hypothetical protein
MRTAFSWKFAPLIVALLIVGLIGGLWASRIGESFAGTMVTGGLVMGVLISTSLVVGGQSATIAAVTYPKPNRFAPRGGSYDSSIQTWSRHTAVGEQRAGSSRANDE